MHVCQRKYGSTSWRYKTIRTLAVTSVAERAGRRIRNLEGCFSWFKFTCFARTKTVLFSQSTGRYRVRLHSMRVARLVLGFLFSISSTFKSISAANAAAITNPSTGSKFTPHTSSSSKRFTIIPSTASANIYWPLESPAPITFPSFNTTTPNESIFTAGQISCNGQ